MKINKTDGVTLIALVITIIILLILAGIAISTLTGDNGILNKAEQAGKDTEIGNVNEEVNLIKSEVGIEEYEGNSFVDSIIKATQNSSFDIISANETKATIKDKKTEREYEIYPIKNNGSTSTVSINPSVPNVPIPKGFYYVGGTENTGVVISDESADENKGIVHGTAFIGNQFVWVPLRGITTANGTIDGVNLNLKFGRREFNGQGMIGGKTTQVGKFTENIPENVIVSVAKYGGFYIGRYEASYKSGTSQTDYIPSSKASLSASIAAWVNTQGRLWNLISYNESVAVCENMYKSSNSVLSHLMYAAEYDTAIQWLLDSGAITYSQMNTDSKEWGNYSDDTFSGTTSIGKSGQWNQTVKNNIYDLTGNLFEWTQEVKDDELKSVHRGR